MIFSLTASTVVSSVLRLGSRGAGSDRRSGEEEEGGSALTQRSKRCVPHFKQGKEKLCSGGLDRSGVIAIGEFNNNNNNNSVWVGRRRRETVNCEL